MKIKISDIDLRESKNTSRDAISWSPRECEELATNMAVNGQLVPVAVRDLSNGKWKLIYGFRRVTAAIMLGWETIDAIAQTEDTDDGLANLIENLMRRDLSLWEECKALKEIFDGSLTHEEIARQLGFSRTWVRTRRRLWECPEEVQLQVQRGELSATDLMEIVKLSPEEQVAKARLVAEAAANGESTRSRLPVRKHPRSIKELRRLQTQIHESGREDWKAIVRFALGEIDSESLFTELDYEPTA